MSVMEVVLVLHILCYHDSPLARLIILIVGTFDCSCVGDLIGPYTGLVTVRRGKKLFRRARSRWGVKVRFSLEQAMKDQKGSRGIAIHFL
jgi:hypothetical protein